MAWRQLVSQFIQDDLAARRSNPGVAAIGQALNIALKQGMETKKAAMDTMMKNPKFAAQTLGLPESAASSGAPIPEGFKPSRVTVDETGQQQTIYEDPTQQGTAPAPTWLQLQKVMAIKDGLTRGIVPMDSGLGGTYAKPVKNLEEAVQAIIENGFDPSLFQEELSKYKDKAGLKASDFVRMKSPDGRVAFINKADMAKAKEMGAVEVK